MIILIKSHTQSYCILHCTMYIIVWEGERHTHTQIICIPPCVCLSSSNTLPSLNYILNWCGRGQAISHPRSMTKDFPFLVFNMSLLVYPWRCSLICCFQCGQNCRYTACTIDLEQCVTTLFSSKQWQRLVLVESSAMMHTFIHELKLSDDWFDNH